MDAHTALTYGDDKTLTKIDTVISDARPARDANKLSIDSHGFTLEPQRTNLKTHEFFDKKNGTVERVYYTEMKRAIKKATGCDEVEILEHIVRDAGAADPRGKKNPFAGGGNGINGYAGVVHTDFRADRAHELARSKGSGKKKMFSSQNDRQRFMIVNTWRNISEDRPIFNNTLALCDGKTVNDVVPEDVQHPNGKRSEQYRLNPDSADQHRWFYFPAMMKDELLIFKQFDSDPNARVRYCFHTAFNDPTIPADAPARQSIEVRAVALFNDTMDRPPPLVRNLSDEVFEARVLKQPEPLKRAPAAYGKRKVVPVKAQKLRMPAARAQNHERIKAQPVVDLDLQRAMEEMDLQLALEESKEYQRAIALSKEIVDLS